MIPFRKLTAWQVAHSLALEIYGMTTSFPVEERFGLTSQLRRAAVSVATNVAEGAGRPTVADRARFVGIALGSVSEVDSLVELAKDLHFLDVSRYGALSARIGRVRQVVSGYHRHLSRER